VRFLAGEVDEAVARADLERHVLVADALPRKAGAREDEEDLLLVGFDVKRRRALAGVDPDPVQANVSRAGGRAEVGPVAADRAGFAVLAL
jgi:hypothetical protein